MKKRFSSLAFSIIVVLATISLLSGCGSDAPKKSANNVPNDKLTQELKGAQKEESKFWEEREKARKAEVEKTRQENELLIKHFGHNFAANSSKDREEALTAIKNGKVAEYKASH